MLTSASRIHHFPAIDGHDQPAPHQPRSECQDACTRIH